MDALQSLNVEPIKFLIQLHVDASAMSLHVQLENITINQLAAASVMFNQLAQVLKPPILTHAHVNAQAMAVLNAMKNFLTMDGTSMHAIANFVQIVHQDNRHVNHKLEIIHGMESIVNASFV